MINKKLKIIYFVDTFYPTLGGMTRVVDFLSTALSNYCDITIVTAQCNSYEDLEKPYKIIRCKGYYSKITHDGIAFPNLDKELKNELLNGGYDLIHCHSCGKLFKFALRYSKILGIPLISSIHNHLYQDIKRYIKFKGLSKLITKYLFKQINKSDYIFAVSDFSKNIIKKLGITKPIYVLPNATIHSNDIEYNEDEINKFLGINKDTIILSYVNRIERTKNVDLIIDSVRYLDKEYKNKLNNVKFVIVGSGSYIKKFKRKINKLNLTKYFIFTGLIYDIKLLGQIYLRSKAILFPSINETCGLSQIEASAYSKPTLAIKNTAVSENIFNDVNGYISDNNFEEYGQQILYIIMNDIKEVGEFANRTLYKYYFDKQFILSIIKLYKRILKTFKF